MVAPILTDEQQLCKELHPILESEEVAEAVLVPSFEGILGSDAHRLRCLLRKNRRKLQRHPGEETLKCNPRRRSLARNFLLL